MCFEPFLDLQQKFLKINFNKWPHRIMYYTSVDFIHMYVSVVMKLRSIFWKILTFFKLFFSKTKVLTKVNVASGPNWFYNTKKILCFWDQKRSCCGFYNTFIAELRVVNLSINREGFKNPVKTEYERPLMDFKSFLPMKITQLLVNPWYANSFSAFVLVF